jgi:hypothetical protein
MVVLRGAAESFVKKENQKLTGDGRLGVEPQT